MKKRFVLTFPPEAVNIPITYNLIKRFDLEVNILNADISSGKSGKLVIEINSDERGIEKALQYTNEHNIQFSEVIRQLSFDNNKCMSCGSCTAVCFAGALSLSKDWELQYDASKCVICGLCIKACPLRLFQLQNE